jgi:hypothetical protein
MIQSKRIQLPSEACSEGLSLARSLGSTISHSTWSRHDPHPFPSHSLHCVVVVAGSAIIASTILDTPPPPKHPPHCHTIHFYASVIPLESNNRTRETLYSARAATRATPPCALSLPSTHGSALTPTALPILLKSRLYATLYEASLDLIFNDPHARAGKRHQELPLDMLSGQ